MDTSFSKQLRAARLRLAGGYHILWDRKDISFYGVSAYGRKTFRFFNSVYGRQNDILTMEQFIKRIKTPLTHIVAVRA